MSLKIFHLIFISFAEILAVVFSIWSWQTSSYTILGVLSAMTAVGLVIYEINIIKKFKEFKS